MTKTIELGNKNYKDYVKELETKGYKCTGYSDSNGKGVAYHENETNVLKIIYEWIRTGHNSYVAGKIIEIDDVTECYK